MRWRVMCVRRVVGDGRFHGGLMPLFSVSIINRSLVNHC